MNEPTRADRDWQEWDLVRVALCGSDEEWALLYGRCEDRDFARGFAEALGLASAKVEERVGHWRAVIEELHPGLLDDGAKATAGLSTAPAAVFSEPVAPVPCFALGAAGRLLCSLRARLASRAEDRGDRAAAT